MSRIVPVLGPEHYKSYSWQQPLVTHWRAVTCEEARCGAWRDGWVTVVDTATELGQRQAAFIRADRSRQHREEPSGTSLVSFTFPPGQQFFAGSPKHEHRKPKGYPPVLLVTGGDWRGNPRNIPVTVHRTAEDWVDDFATHQEMLARAQR